MEEKMITKFLLTMVLFLYALANHCDSPHNAENNTNKIIDRGEGIYYFDYVKKDFTDALVKFKKEHPELIITSSNGDGNGEHGRDIGYWVITEKRATCK